MKIYFCSKTGNVESFANYLNNLYNIEKNKITRNSKDIISDEFLVIGTWTKFGRVPKEMKDFLSKNRDNIKGKKVFIFGSGNSMYKDYNTAMLQIKKFVEYHDGEVLGMYGYEQTFKNNIRSKKFISSIGGYI